MILAADLPPHAPSITICRPHKPAGARDYWQWREIEGTRCWYAGRVVKPKSELRWQAVPPRSPPEGSGEESVASSPPRERGGLPPTFKTIRVRPVTPDSFDDRWQGFMRCRYSISGNWNC